MPLSHRPPARLPTGAPARRRQRARRLCRRQSPSCGDRLWLRRLLPGPLIRHGGPAGLPLAEREDEGVQAPAQALLGRIVQRVGIATKRVQPPHLPTQGVVADVAKQRGFGRHRVQRLAAGHGEPLGQGSAQHEVVHKPAGHVVAGGGHVVVAATQTRVYLEETVAAVARIHLDVEVRESGVADSLQKARGLGHDGLVGAAHDGERIAHPHGPHILQKRLAERGEAHLSVTVGVGGENAHARVVAGNHLLDEEFPLVAAGLHRRKRRLQLRRVAQEEHLLLAGKIGIVVGRRGSGLGHHGEGEGECHAGGIVAVRAGVEHHGARHGHAHFGAQRVEAILLGEPVQQFLVDVGDDEGLLQHGAVLHDEAHVPVAAAEQKQRAVAEALGSVGQGGEEDRRPLQVRHHAVREDGGVAAQVARGLREHQGHDAVGLVEGPGDTVGADVSAEDHRQHVGGVRLLHETHLLNIARFRSGEMIGKPSITLPIAKADESVRRA